MFTFNPLTSLVPCFPIKKLLEILPVLNVNSKNAVKLGRKACEILFHCIPQCLKKLVLVGEIKYALGIDVHAQSFKIIY